MRLENPQGRNVSVPFTAMSSESAKTVHINGTCCKGYRVKGRRTSVIHDFLADANL